MKFALLKTLLLSATILGPNLLHAQRSDNGLSTDAIVGAEATALVRQLTTERARLLEERRQALLRADKAGTPEEKFKIMQEFETSIKSRHMKLREDEAKVRSAIAAERRSKRVNQTKG